jgi:hypothetical protein
MWIPAKSVKNIRLLQVFGLAATGILLAALAFAGQSKSSPTIPQTFPPPEPDRPHLQIDQPPTVVHGENHAPLNTAQAKQDADELAKLAQSIPAEVDKVSKGQLPGDLGARLKRIEKLSKQVRRDIGE